MKENRFVFMLKSINVVLIALIGCTIAALVALPFILDIVQQYFIALIPTLIFFYTGGALLIWFFYNLKTMIATVRTDSPFIPTNVKRLNVLSLSLFLLAADFVYLLFYTPSLSKVLGIIILSLGGFSARILAYLVQKAIEYKEDVDLTI